MTESSSIVLKIFSGPHLGAEVPLSAGSYILGSNSSCDIILKDSTIAERHLKIIVPENIDHPQQLLVKEIDAPFTLHGSETAEDIETVSTEDSKTGPQSDKTEWSSLTPLMLGTTSFAWKSGKESWKDIADTGILDGTAFLQLQDQADTGLPADDPDREKKESGKKTIVVPKLLARILKGLGVILILLFVFGPCYNAKQVKLARNMESLLKKEGFEYLSVVQTNIGVTVLGTVDTQAQRTHLWQIAGKADYPVFIDIKVREERSFAVKVALSVRGLFPEVELNDNDIVMKGYMRDKLIEGASKIWVKKDIANVEKIDSSMVYAFQVWPVLKDKLVQYKLEKLLVIRFYPGLVQVEGELDFDQRQILEKIKGEVIEALGSPIAFWDTLTAPGFSAEWNASLNSGLRSRYAPDPGLAKIFLDSQASKGMPALTADTPAHKAGEGASSQLKSLKPAPLKTGKKLKKDRLSADDGKEARYAVDKKGNILTDSKGNPILLGKARDSKGKILKDADNVAIPLVVARDSDGNIVRDKDGNPILLPALLDRLGRILRGKDGEPVAPRVIAGSKDKAIFDKEGRLIPDQGANKVLVDRYDTGDDTTKLSEGSVLGRGIEALEGGSVDSDKKLFGSGTVIADKIGEVDEHGQKVAENPLEGVEIVSITLDPIPFISMKDGQKFFTGAKLPSGYIIKKIDTDQLVLERDKNSITYKIRLE